MYQNTIKCPYPFRARSFARSCFLGRRQNCILKILVILSKWKRESDRGEEKLLGIDNFNKKWLITHVSNLSWVYFILIFYKKGDYYLVIYIRVYTITDSSSLKGNSLLVPRFSITVQKVHIQKRDMYRRFPKGIVVGFPSLLKHPRCH